MEFFQRPVPESAQHPVLESAQRPVPESAQRPAPASVAETVICWPLGIAADAQPAALCARKAKAWVLDGVVPPTYREQRS